MKTIRLSIVAISLMAATISSQALAGNGYCDTSNDPNGCYASAANTEIRLTKDYLNYVLKRVNAKDKAAITRSHNAFITEVQLQCQTNVCVYNSFASRRNVYSQYAYQVNPKFHPSDIYRN